MMASLPARLTPTALLLGSLGASCGGGRELERRGQRNDEPPERIESLDGFDTSTLTANERRLWVRLVNEQLAPCGEPIAVARCIAERRACRGCVGAARYLLRLVTEGYGAEEIAEAYRRRYGPDGAVRFELDHAPVRGDPTAAVTLVVFSDFECPYCAAAHPVLQRLLREHDGQVRLAFLHYPLEGHPHARAAARAAVAAHIQGKFWAMHDRLFENQDRLTDSDLREHARAIGLDMARFERDFLDPATAERIEADRAQGRRAAIRGTPTIFVNGRRFDEPLEALEPYVREELLP
ncbi:MAG: thioredoxin domain-containing protein [Myxococcota bacterium]|nr:thioredoxin domain-containing protein [Myxococcota bacterium]MDW8361401.1 thioredoxin domain-containing protein [Myxococcales bacterium]